MRTGHQTYGVAMPPTPRRRTVGQQLSVPMSAFWRGGAGPTHDEIDVVLRGEGIDPSAMVMAKHAKVSAALAQASDQTAVDLASGLVDLLRHTGHLDVDSDAESTRRQQALRTVLRALGAELDADGCLTWSADQPPAQPGPVPRQDEASSEAQSGPAPRPASAPDVKGLVAGLTAFADATSTFFRLS
jgi:hypothetical protein